MPPWLIIIKEAVVHRESRNVLEGYVMQPYKGKLQLQCHVCVAGILAKFFN